MPRKTYGYAVVNSGEKAIVYNLEGEARLIDGPQRLYLWREKIEMLRRHTASQTEYLIVKYRDGRVEHVKGPCSMFRIPTIHDMITTKKAITIDAHEVLVVYRHNNQASEKTVERHLEYGPKMFVPASNEWLHNFSWHGVDPANKTKYIPGLNQFTKLKLIPDQFYYNVDEIRTSDNGLIRVKLMIFHEIVDVNTMLSATHDPIGDIISCISADVTAFTAARTYMEFVDTSAKLNEMENYPHLSAMCKSSGVRVTKVVFRGYFAAPKIQASHDSAIDRRTTLQSQYESEAQRQDMEDRELSAERDRIASSHALEIQQLKQTQKIDKMKQDHRLNMRQKTRQQSVEQKKAKASAEYQHTQNENAQLMEHYKQLKELGVDLTKYIVNEAAIPEKITRVIAEGGNNKPLVHLHLGKTSHPEAVVDRPLFD